MRPADDNPAAVPTPVPDAEDPRASALRAAGVAHDVNQMLAVISGRAELLLARAPEHRAHLQAILLAAGDAAAMLQRLGEPSAAAAAGAVVGAAAAIADAAVLVRPPSGSWAEAGARGAPGTWSLSVEAEDGLGAALPPSVLREALVNLLLNALGALPEGGRILITAGRHGGACRLRVADSGPGLPVADPEQVFAVGYSTSGRPGRGIGLAACRQLLAGHGARLDAACHGGPGAVFTIDAPFVAAPAGRPATVPAADPLPAGAGGMPVASGLEVLVIDDEPAVREMLGDALAEFGCTVTCHRDGAGALAAGAPGTAALALVDRRLPGLDGVEVAARLRERQPALVVALMSGWDRDVAPPPATLVDFTLRKPLALSGLRETLAQASALWDARAARGPRGAGGS